MTIRTCTVDGGSKNHDVELIRIDSSCGPTVLVDGSFGLDIDTSDPRFRLYACIEICSNSHGCNKSAALFRISRSFLFFIVILSIKVNHA